MFEGFKADLIPFLLDIRFNNNRTFMEEHREEYRARVRDPFYAFIGAMAPILLSIDGDMEVRPEKCLSRINRDIRFSRDKAPYRDHHWVAFRQTAVPRENMPFFWFEIRIETVSWGLGMWGENRAWLDALKRRVTAKPDELLALLPILRERGFRLGGTDFKKAQPPDGLAPELIPWYMKREIYLEKENVDPGCIYRADIVKRVGDDFIALAPFWRLFRGLVELEAEK